MTSQQEAHPHKWRVLGVVILGSFMVGLSNNSVNVALPKIMANFGSAVDQIEWVVTGYMIALAICMPTTAWLHSAFGLKNVFITSLAVFCFGSALCGLAWDNDSLVAFRVLQGLGGGALMPTGLTLVTQAFPPQERGMAMGTWSIGAMVAPALGPFVGGYLSDEVSWRAIFYSNLPAGAVAMLAALRVFAASRKSQPPKKFDFLGFGSLSTFLAFLLLALTQGQREGWDSDYILSCFGLSALGFVSFICSNFLVKNPLIDLRVFANLNFVMANMINFLRAISIFGSLFLLPLFLENLLQYKALETGIILAPFAMTVAIVSPFSGLISDRIGPCVPLSLGTFLVALSLYLFKDLSLDSDYYFLLWPQIVRGVGIGLINAPLMSSAVNSVRREQTSTASSMLTVFTQLGGAFGVSLLGAVLQRREYFHYAHYLQQINNTFSSPISHAQSVMEQLLLRQGYSPADLPAKGKVLLGIWVQQRATVSAFGDTFIFAALLLAIGIIPALLIRKVREGQDSRPAES